MAGRRILIENSSLALGESTAGRCVINLLEGLQVAC